jgi:succinate dehydrogenase hydrophobic anchor subunit
MNSYISRSMNRRHQTQVAASKDNAQRVKANLEAGIWIVTYVLALVGLVNAAYSEEPVVWLAIWPAPIVLVSTIFIFFRQGFHFRNGLLVLGRRRN